MCAFHGHGSGIQNKVADAGGKIPAIHHIDIIDFFRSQTGIGIANGHIAADSKVNDCVALTAQRRKEINIICGIDCGGATDAVAAVYPFEDVFRADLNCILVGFIALDNIQRNDTDTKLIDQFGREITGAVGRNDDVHDNSLFRGIFDISRIIILRMPCSMQRTCKKRYGVLRFPICS